MLSSPWSPLLHPRPPDINPEVVLLDEPTASVDVLNRHIFWDLIRELAAEGKTLFVWGSRWRSPVGIRLLFTMMTKPRLSVSRPISGDFSNWS